MCLQLIGTLLRIAATCDEQSFDAVIARLLERIRTVAIMTSEPNRLTGYFENRILPKLRQNCNAPDFSAAVGMLHNASVTR